MSYRVDYQMNNPEEIQKTLNKRELDGYKLVSLSVNETPGNDEYSPETIVTAIWHRPEESEQ